MQSVSEEAFFNLLSEKHEPVALDDIPDGLKDEIEQFMFGRTVTKINGCVAFYPGDFNEWIEKVKTKGLSYDVQLL